ncbi:MAG: preprotein translocase subunit SecE [Prevotellaceae bacterium]|nr:preprotein translocase subunit SecE [Prevotellaceae bacterium]
MSKIAKVYLGSKGYLKKVYEELATKVTWPGLKELQSSAILVMIASLIFAIVVFVMDFGFQNIIKGIYSVLLGQENS